MSAILRDLDSRLRGVTSGVAGIVRPRLRAIGNGQLGEPVFCTSCGRRCGHVTVGLPPGVIVVCDACTANRGLLPLEVIHYQPDEEAI